MLAALRQQRGCHLITRILENHLEYFHPIRHILITASQDNPILESKTIKNHTSTNCSYQSHSYHKQVKPNIKFKRTSLPDPREGSYGSRFHPPSQIEAAEDRIKDALSTSTLLTSEEWAEVKTNLMDDIAILTEVNFSSIVMNSLLTLNKVDEARAFLEYLNSANIEVNFLAHLTYMDLCARNVEKCGQEVILRSFKKVKPFMDASPVLDLKRAEHLISGLCATDRWALSLDYLKMIPIKPNMVIKNSLVLAAIRNRDESLAWDVLTRWLRTDEVPNNRVFQELFQYVLRLGLENKKRSEEFLVKVLEYMRRKGCVVNEDVVKVIKEVFDW